MFFSSSDEDEEEPEPFALALVFFPLSFSPSESELSEDEDEDDEDEEDEDEPLLSAFLSFLLSVFSCFPLTSLLPRGASPCGLSLLSDWLVAALRLSRGGACGARLARAF